MYQLVPFGLDEHIMLADGEKTCCSITGDGKGEKTCEGGTEGIGLVVVAPYPDGAVGAFLQTVEPVA